MNTALSLLFPVINVIVTGAFASVVLRQYGRRHKLYQLYWSIALSMAFIATAAYVVMVAAQPTSAAGITLFRVYYIFGAAIMPSWLGLGSIALVAKPRVTRICFVALLVLSVVAAALIIFAGIDLRQLSHIAGTPGAGILQPAAGAWLFMLITLNSLGLLAVAGVAIYSGWRLLARRGTTNLLWGNTLILAGAVLNGLAGATARLGIENIFWLVMSVGWIVFFVGVLFASRPQHRAAAATTPAQQAAQRS